MTSQSTKPAVAVSEKDMLTTVKALMGMKSTIAGVLKGLDEGVLREVEQIHGAIEDHRLPNENPTRSEVDFGRPQAMRGGEAQREVALHSDIHPQTGTTKLAEQMDAMFGDIRKCFTILQDQRNSIAIVAKGMTAMMTVMNAAIQKAEDEKSEEDKRAASMQTEEATAKAKETAKAEALAKAHADKDAALELVMRKARLAIAKAEDSDEDETDESMEKARAALDAVKAHLSKAEEDAEDDDDEKRAEKARAATKALKARIEKRAAVLAKAKETAAPVKATMADVEAGLSDYAKSKGMPVADLIALIGGGGQQQHMVHPPMFMKAIQEGTLTVDAVQARVDEACNEAGWDQVDVGKARALVSRLGAVQKGSYSPENFARELTNASPQVRALFEGNLA